MTPTIPPSLLEYPVLKDYVSEPYGPKGSLTPDAMVLEDWFLEHQLDVRGDMTNIGFSQVDLMGRVLAWDNYIGRSRDWTASIRILLYVLRDYLPPAPGTSPNE